ncbi:MAG: YbhB/YbcL family Raf kinase inhibitor-like protein [Salibacteraceae bacterium]
MKNFIATICSLLLISSFSIAQSTFTLSSKTLGGNATMTEEFNGFGCTGKNQSPELTWKNPPEGTKSFAITMYDPDAPTGSGWWHWLVFDIPSATLSIPENAGNVSMNLMPQNAIQSITDYSAKGYGGPCPPENHGLHQYVITVYALKTDKLGLTEDTNPAVIGFYLWNNAIAKASIVTYYKREQ